MQDRISLRPAGAVLGRGPGRIGVPDGFPDARNLRPGQDSARPEKDRLNNF